jgi:hypothetical protein
MSLFLKYNRPSFFHNRPGLDWRIFDLSKLGRSNSEKDVLYLKGLLIILLASLLSLIAGAIGGQFVPDRWKISTIFPSVISQFPSWTHPLIVTVTMLTILGGWLLMFRYRRLGQLAQILVIGALSWLIFRAETHASASAFRHWQLYCWYLVVGIVVATMIVHSWWSRLILTSIVMTASLLVFGGLNEHDVVSIQIGIVIFDILAVYYSPFMEEVADQMGKLKLPNQLLVSFLEENQDDGVRVAEYGLGGGDVVVPGMVLMLAMQQFQFHSWITWICPVAVLLAWTIGYLLFPLVIRRLSGRDSHPATIVLSPAVLIGYYLSRWLIGTI